MKHPTTTPTHTAAPVITDPLTLGSIPLDPPPTTTVHATHALDSRTAELALSRWATRQRSAKRLGLQIILWATLPYLLGYVSYRQSHLETWERDNRSYIMFPSSDSTLASLFAPLLWLDNIIAGVDHRVGEHPTPAPIDSGVYLRTE